MSYYQQHVFFCTNQRTDGRKCCEQAGASQLRAYAKAKIKSLGLSGKGQVRINTAGCLDRCGQGPVIVVYPGEVWYRYQNEADIDEIIEQHLVKNQPVKRLMLG
ncbi:Ferredoxin, 2Fe-2S [hydrothermal vent metagenome]|uniref:Ferredoxin, 2Fe-2S n=1 Tax=hydrothermal vent metagenome TaxID=652676 RepID=A0A3B0WSD6_9ZZZZ